MNRNPVLKIQNGFTLVELMIALVLGLVLVGGVISVLMSNQQTYRTNTVLSQLQDNSRTAFELMARDIRQAGSTPCGNTAVTNNLTSLNGAGTDTYIWGTNPIQGFDNATTVAPALTGALAQSAIVTQGVGVVSDARITPGAACAAGAPLTLAASTTAPSGIASGDLVMACDASQAYIYQGGAFAGGVLKLATAGSPGNAAASLPGCASFGQTAYVAQYQPDYWYVAPAGTGAPANTNSLYRARFAAGAFTADEVVRGVVTMQITYHTTNGAAFTNAAGVAGAWNTVDAVQVTLTLQGTDARAGTSSTNVVPLVRTFTTTIGIR